MNKMSIKKDDLVVVLSGKDKGKQGKVLEVMPKSGKVVVEKVNVVSRHTKPPQAGRAGRHPPEGGPHLRLQGAEGLPKCNKPTRIGHKVEGATRRSASARSAAPRSERGGVNRNG